MLLRGIEDRAVDKATLVMHLYTIGGEGHLAFAFHEHLILQTAGQGDDTFFLGVGSEELTTCSTVGTVEALLAGCLVGLTLGEEILFGSSSGESGGVLQESCSETIVETAGDNRVGRVLELLSDTRQHALIELLRNLHAHEIGLHLGIVGGAHDLTEAAHEIGHIGGVYLMLLHEERHQTIGDIHACCIAHGVGAGAQLGKRRSTRHECECHDEQLLHNYFLGLTSSSSILKIRAENGLMMFCSRSP